MKSKPHGVTEAGRITNPRIVGRMLVDGMFALWATGPGCALAAEYPHPPKFLITSVGASVRAATYHTVDAGEAVELRLMADCLRGKTATRSLKTQKARGGKSFGDHSSRPSDIRPCPGPRARPPHSPPPPPPFPRVPAPLPRTLPRRVSERLGRGAFDAYLLQAFPSRRSSKCI